MDWRMPEFDGVGTTAEILARRPTTVVVAFSSALDTAVAGAFWQTRPAAYAMKPDIDVLIAELRRHHPNHAA
jgi:hypothetical protein